MRKRQCVPKKLQYDFPKMRGEGIKGRLELFRIFISFNEGFPKHPKGCLGCLSCP